ncbi:odorant receptor 67c-like [Fopius arisanus]|uniref:Odorant receptor n=1 Tax=Fopius arisanus TaxID=64838 RepID=A0A9R1TG58_9HYME|nr:PREDICTED: odorant receptor 67c-like [Fopius arisanus]
MRDKVEILGTVPKPSKRSKADVKYSTELNRWFLTLIGIWPTRSDAHILKKILSEILFFLSCFLLFFAMVPAVLHTILKEKDPQRKMKMTGPLIFHAIVIIKHFILVMKKREIRECLEHMDVDWRRVAHSDEREIMLMKAKFGRFIFLLDAVFMYSGGFFHSVIVPLSMDSFVTPDNITIRPLSYAVYEPLFSTQTKTAYEIVFTIQYVSAFVANTITIGCSGLAGLFVLHICGQFNIVRSRLESWVRGRTDESKNVEERMAEIIYLHLRALKFGAQVEMILTEICLIDFVGSIIHICFLGYYFITVMGKIYLDNLWRWVEMSLSDEFEQNAAICIATYCVLLVSLTFNIFIFCYIGELLTQQGEKIGTTAYMIPWHELPPKNSRAIILILAMTKQPATITAGKMVELSIRSFSTVLRTAAAYLNLLRTISI